MQTLGIKFLNGISQKITPRLQNVFVDYKMYSVPSPHKHFLLNNFYRIISQEKLRGRRGGGGFINPMLPLTSANGRVRDDEFMLGSCSDHARIGRALELTLQLFSANFSLILECNFAWQAQYLVRLEGDACCSAHCK